MRIFELLHGLVSERTADPDDPRGNLLGIGFSGSTGSLPMQTDAAAGSSNAAPLGQEPMPSVVVQPVTPAVGGPHGPQPPTMVASSPPGGAENSMDTPLQSAEPGLPVPKGRTA